MTYRGIVSNGVVVLEGKKPVEGTVVEVTPVDESAQHPLDIRARLYELRALGDGWLEGKGKSPSPAGLDWLAAAFEQRFAAQLRQPYLYPTAEGGIQAEWSMNPWEIFLEIDLATRTAHWHCLNLQAGNEESRQLDLNSPDSWQWLEARIGQMGRSAE
jgi:hypothetical protein